MNTRIGDLVEISGMDGQSTVCLGIVLTINKQFSYCTVSLVSSKFFDSVSSFSISGNYHLYPAVQGTVWLAQVSKRPVAISLELAESLRNWYSIQPDEKVSLGVQFETNFVQARTFPSQDVEEFEDCVRKLAQLSKDCVYSLLGGVFSLDLPEDLEALVSSFGRNSGFHEWDYALATTAGKEKARIFHTIAESRLVANKDLSKYFLLRENRLTQTSLGIETGVSKALDRALDRALKMSKSRLVFTSSAWSAKWDQKHLKIQGKFVDFTLIRRELIDA